MYVRGWDTIHGTSDPASRVLVPVCLRLTPGTGGLCNVNQIGVTLYPHESITANLAGRRAHVTTPALRRHSPVAEGHVHVRGVVPEWFGMLAVTTLLVTVFLGGFFFSEIGKQALLDKMAESTPAQQMAQIAPNIGIIAAVQAGFILVFGPIFAFVVAGILMGVFTVTGGTAAFKQVLAVVAHAGVVSRCRVVITAISLRSADADERNDDLAVFMPSLEEKSFLGRVPGHDRPDAGLVAVRPGDRPGGAVPASHAAHLRRLLAVYLVIACGVGGL